MNKVTIMAPIRSTIMTIPVRARIKRIGSSLFDSGKIG